MPPSFLLFLVLAFLSPDNPSRIPQLKPQADAVLKLDPPAARRKVGIVFELADCLFTAGRLEEADHYYNAGLQISPNDFENRLFYAELLAKMNRPDSVKTQAQLILQGSENQSTILKARELIGLPPPQIAAMDDLPGAMPIVVLVPLGDVDLSILLEEQAKLHDALHIDVELRSVPFKMPPPDRRPRTKTPENVQWSAVKMMDSFSDAVHPFAADNDNVRFIGVTKYDIYAENNNYNFGWTGENCSIVSYRRFMASFDGQPSDRARLLRRFHFQCLTSTAHLFGLDRCMDSSCPCGYAQSVDEQDAKTDKLCDTCQKGFDDAFAVFSTAAQTRSTVILVAIAAFAAVGLTIVSLINRHPLPLTALILAVALFAYTAVGIGIQRVGNGPMYPAFARTYLYAAATCAIVLYGVSALMLYQIKKSKAQEPVAVAC